MDHVLTPERRAYRDARLVENLRLKYPQLANYPDPVLVRAYDSWFLTCDSDGTADQEDAFIAHLTHEWEPGTHVRLESGATARVVSGPLMAGPVDDMYCVRLDPEYLEGPADHGLRQVSGGKLAEVA